MDKIRNTTIAKRRSRATLSPQTRKDPRASKQLRPTPRRPKGATTSRAGILGFLLFLVSALLVANVYFFVSSMPTDALSRFPKAQAQADAAGTIDAGNEEIRLAAMPSASPLRRPSASPRPSSPAGSPVAYSSDIDDLSDYSLIVNKSRLLSPDYEPGDLDYPAVPFAKGKMRLRAAAARAYERMHAAAKAQGINFSFYSGYRDYPFQKQIWENSVRVNGLDWASQFIAPPGASEHQTGLAVDISCAETKQQLDDSFAQTPSGIWLATHCAEFGFILRYPEGGRDITGYSYEPWHFRYVGEALAADLRRSGLTMEEFFHLSP